MGELSLQTWASGEFGYLDLLDVAKDGKTIATIKRGENAATPTITTPSPPDGKTVIKWRRPWLPHGLRSDGRALGKFVGHTSDVWAVTVSSDGPSGSDDQTVRLWKHGHAGERGVALLWLERGNGCCGTPQGYYAASPSGDAHVGWQVNEGERVCALRQRRPAQAPLLSARHRHPRACAGQRHSRRE